MDYILAIHKCKGRFADRWIEYCLQNGIDFKIVNCYRSDIIEQLSDVKGFLWHWNNDDPIALKFGRAIIASAEAMGITVFPNWDTCWHYDDKVSQKYLLEAIGVPLVPSYVFYDMREALEWIDKTTFPKVFKLSGGSGSSNVRLVKNAGEAKRLVQKAFTKGFDPVDIYFKDTKLKLRKIKKASILLQKIKNIPAAYKDSKRNKFIRQKDCGYIYFQDFIPDNDFDTRVTIIGNRAFAFTRNTRKKDFRASGSGEIVYDLKRIRLDCIKIGFDIAEKIGAQSLAIDFVISENNEIQVLEISYCYQAEAVYNCLGHWDIKMVWHEGKMWPQDAILIDLLSHIKA